MEILRQMYSDTTAAEVFRFVSGLETGYVTQAVFGLETLLPQHPKYWDYQHNPLHLATFRSEKWKEIIGSSEG